MFGRDYLRMECSSLRRKKFRIHKPSKLWQRVIVAFWQRASTSIEQSSRDCGIVSVQEPVYLSLGPRWSILITWKFSPSMYLTSIDILFVPEFTTLYVMTEVRKSEPNSREVAINSISISDDDSVGFGLILPCRNRRRNGLTTSSLLAMQWSCQ